MSWAKTERRRAGRSNGAPGACWPTRRSAEQRLSLATISLLMVNLLAILPLIECSSRASKGRATDGSGRGRRARRLTFRSHMKGKAQVVDRNSVWACLLALAFIGVLAHGTQAQQPAATRGPQAQERATEAPRSARASAPKDFTGYWVSVVTEQWNLRMLMPPKGVYTMLPLNSDARAVADAWTQERDAGNECRGYGGAPLIR